MPDDYYFVLGISRGADLTKIKRAYRKVAKQHHPDITHSEKSAKKFREIREAYETLADEEKRRKYDAQLNRKGSSLKMSRVSEAIKQQTALYGEMDRLSTFVDDFFEGFLPGCFDRDRGRISGKDLYYEVILSPSEAFEGGLFPITVPVITPCPKCGKTGLWENFFCPVCYGEGRVQSERTFSLSIPPRIKHGKHARVSLADIGLRGTYLHLLILITP